MGIELKDFIALYAAIVSTVAVVWSVIVWYRDKHRITVSLGIERVSDGLEESKPRYEMVFRIVNIGRRPVTITRLGFEGIPRENESPFLYEERDKMGISKPFVLQSADWHDSRLPASPFYDESIRWWAVDSFKKIHYTKWSNEIPDFKKTVAL